METTTRQVPPGLLATELEIFFYEGELYAMVEGQKKRFDELPQRILDKVQAVLDDDVEASKLLRSHGPERPAEQLWLYAKCRFGGYNATPDLCLENSREPDQEYWQCGEGCQCVLRPLFRDSVAAENGALTKREVQVIRLLAGGAIGEAVAAELGMSPSGLNKHKKKIFVKCGVQSIQELMLYAQRKGLLL